MIFSVNFLFLCFLHIIKYSIIIIHLKFIIPEFIIIIDFIKDSTHQY